jgi:dTDP-4-amino-4,6-dideoxygalactose transaminase
VIGLEALKRLDGWTAEAQANARYMNSMLEGIPGIQVPVAPPDRTHVYYQYCVYGPDGPERDELVVRCVRRGVDIETLHVDIPPDMPLFEGATAERDGARRAAQAIQIPIYAGLTGEQRERVARVVRDVLVESGN